MAFVGILSQIKLLFGPLVIQLVWYILKQLFTSLSVKVVYQVVVVVAVIKIIFKTFIITTVFVIYKGQSCIWGESEKGPFQPQGKTLTGLYEE